MERKAYFISDLHLFSRRSQADLYADAIFEAARDAHTFVLGGDIFDFKWTTLGSLDETVSAAASWLHKLASRHPECDFVFVLGNHDSHPAFVDRLAETVDENANLSWHRHFVRSGDCVFLHGDVVDAGGAVDHESLDQRRHRFSLHAPPKPTTHLLYDAAVFARLHVLASSVVNRPHGVLRKIANYLHHIGQGPESGVRHVYFGHTHRELADVEFGGLTFHNPGAPMKGIRFRIVETALSDRGSRS